MNKFYTITNGKISVTLCSIGAAITSFVAKDRFGNDTEILLGYKDKAKFEKNGHFFGSTIGRVPNRLKNASVLISGKEYSLEKNDGENSLHGGFNGFHAKNFTVKSIATDFIELCYKSPDLEAGYPGTMEASVRYSVTADNGLLMEFGAICDKDTLCAMTNHAYFTLGGKVYENSIYDFTAQIDADTMLELDETQCITGKFLSVKGTPFDFTAPKKIGADIENAKGYDLFYCINDSTSFKKAATVSNPNSGITLEVHTDCKGVQFYSGNFLEGEFHRRSAFCLEAHRLPGILNDLFLKANTPYKAKMMYKII